MLTLSIRDRKFESIERTWLINQSGNEPRLVDCYAVRGSERLFSETDLRIAFSACGEIVSLAQGYDYQIQRDFKTATSWRVKSTTDKAEVQDIGGQADYKVIMADVERIEAAIMNGEDMVRPVSVVSTDPAKNQIQILDEKTVLLSQELCGQDIKMWQVPIVYDEVAISIPVKRKENGKMPTCDVNMLGYDLVTETWQLCEIKGAVLVPKNQAGDQRVLQFKIHPENIEFRQVCAGIS